MTTSKAAWDYLVGLETFETDTSPSAADYIVGATLTGVSSGTTATVVAVIDSDNYIIKDRDGDWTDGEVIGDGTNTSDNGAGYPVMAEFNLVGAMLADTQFGAAKRARLSALLAKAKPVDSGHLSKSDLKIIGDLLSELGSERWPSQI